MVANRPLGLAAASVGAGLAAVGVIAWATAVRSHAFVAFVAWVGLTVASVACGVVALIRMPRTAGSRNARRAAAVGVIIGVGCATLGLAVYSAARAGDCPRDGPCTIPTSGPGQRNQQP